jgi:hypothetical protein
MACHIQIGDDPTIWWLAQQIQPSQLTQPLAVLSWYPIRGNLVLSPKAATWPFSLRLPCWYRHPCLVPAAYIFRPRPGRPQDTSGMSCRVPSTRRSSLNRSRP